MEQVITFTATRSMTSRGRRIIRDVCSGFNGTPPAKFVTGCAVGGDTVTALACLTMYPKSIHHICIPDYAHNEELAWYLSLLQEEAHPSQIITEYTGLPPLERDDRMLDLGTELYAFPSTPREQMRGSGTWATIRHARKRAMQISAFPLDRSEPWVENA